MARQSDLQTSPFRFQIGLRFELFFALQVLTDPESRIHPMWRARALAQLPGEFDKDFQSIGGSSTLWGTVSDVFESQPVNLNFDEVVAEIRKMPITLFQKRILLGEIHYEDLVAEVLTGKCTLEKGLGKVPKVKQEWLAFVGLYPYDATAPIARAMEFLIKKPEEFREKILKLMILFWERSFKQTWSDLQYQFRRSLDEKERLFQSCSFEEFSKQALLRIDVDGQKGIIKALRGGYKLPLYEIKECVFLPSAFNDKRYWTAYKVADGRTNAYFPYFDPSVSLDLSLVGTVSEVADPELDPALVFKALGDSTRFALITIIAKKPTTSVELSKLLSVSKPTISHHVNQLREAGLLEERYLNGSVLLSVKKAAIERLSKITIQRLFHSEKDLSVKLKRSKK